MKAFSRLLLFGLLVLSGRLTGFAEISSRQNNLIGKFTVVSVDGLVTAIVDGKIIDLKKGDTLRARGSVVESGAKAKAAILFSNQTSVILDENTHIEVLKFDQEFFAPNNNLRVEPSNSSSIVKLRHGRAVISTPRLLSGTTMVYETNHAMIGIRGDRLLIETDEKQTHVAMIAGTATVNPRGEDGEFVSIGKRLLTGQEAFVKYTLGADDKEVADKQSPPAAAANKADPAAPATSAPAEPAAVAAVAPATAQAEGHLATRPGEAIVLKLSGPATAKRPTDVTVRDLSEGDLLPAGTLITTDETTELYLQPFEGTITALRPKTSVHIEKLLVTTEDGVVKKQTTLLALKAGTVVSTIDPARSAINDYGIRTPKGIASAKGTSFSVSVENDGWAVATTADAVSFVTPEGVTYNITAGNVTMTPAGGEPQPPVSLASAVAASPGFAEVIVSALNAVTTVVQSNLGSLPPNSATDLITKVASTAAAALPKQVEEITTKAITAVMTPQSATSTQQATAAQSVTSAIAAAAPAQAAQIATSAALAAPQFTAAVSAGAAQAAPGQAAQIASAVAQTLVQTSSDGNVTPASLQAASAVAAAVTTAAPSQAAPVAAAVLQALSTSAPLSTPLSLAQNAATIAAAVTASAPPQAVPVSAIMMKTMTSTPAFADASSQLIAQTAAVLASAVTTVVPPQAQQVATAVMQLLLEVDPTASPAVLTQTAGVLAAAVSQVVPEQAGAVAQSVALAANQSVSAVQTSAAQAGQVLVLIGMQLTEVVQTAGLAVQASGTALGSAASASTASSSVDGSTGMVIANTGFTMAVPTFANGAGGDGEVLLPTEAATSVIVTQFDPSSVSELNADIEAAQAAQTSVQFSSDTTNNGGSFFSPNLGGGTNNNLPGQNEGEGTVLPVPVVPSIPPVEFTASASNLTTG